MAHGRSWATLHFNVCVTTARPIFHRHNQPKSPLRVLLLRSHDSSRAPVASRDTAAAAARTSAPSPTVDAASGPSFGIRSKVRLCHTFSFGLPRMPTSSCRSRATSMPSGNDRNRAGGDEINQGSEMNRVGTGESKTVVSPIARKLKRKAWGRLDNCALATFFVIL